MLKAKAVIFDLDGVLADSNEAVERHLKFWSDRHGIPFTSVLEIHHGRPTVETIAMLAPHLDPIEEARLIEAVAADDVLGVRPFAGALRLVDSLPAGWWAIATSGTFRIASNRLVHIGIPQPEVFITANDIERGKPAPDPYLMAAERLGVAPEACVVIEDAPAGIVAGKAAGAKVIAVASTMPASALAGADVVVARLDDLEIVVDETELCVSWRYPHDGQAASSSVSGA